MKKLMLLPVLLLGACHPNVTYQTGLPPAPTTREHTARSYLGFTDSEIAGDGDCPDGVASIELIKTAGNNLATMFTLGLYSPRTLVVRCALARK